MAWRGKSMNSVATLVNRAISWRSRYRGRPTGAGHAAAGRLALRGGTCFVPPFDFCTHVTLLPAGLGVVEEQQHLLAVLLLLSTTLCR